jgi:8-oxo-dGTP pyrophosphatase MutT (NUDIX family)
MQRLFSALRETMSAKQFPTERGAVTIQLQGDLRIDYGRATTSAVGPEAMSDVCFSRTLSISTDPAKGACGDFNLAISGDDGKTFSFFSDAVHGPASDNGTLLEPITVTQHLDGISFQLVFRSAKAATPLKLEVKCHPQTVMSAATSGIPSEHPVLDLHRLPQAPPASPNLVAETRPQKSLRQPILTHSFALALVEQDGRFLLVQERKLGNPWYLPAGRVEFGETIFQAVVRETLEEAGVRVQPLHLLHVEHSPAEIATRASRMRFIFRCQVVGSDEPKSVSDEHSLRAGWFSLEEIEQLPLRHSEVLSIIRRYRSSEDSE